MVKNTHVSLITPIHPDNLEHLSACKDSFLDAKERLMEMGITSEWIIAFDGALPDINDTIHASANIIIGKNKHHGVAWTRNMAAHYASGSWIIPLDGDDTLHYEFPVFCQALLRMPSDISWVGGNRLLMSGEKTAHWNDAPKDIPAGHLADNWSSPFLFHPNSLAVRHEALDSVGGWPLLDVNEDMALALLLGERYKGKILTEIMHYYRVWEKQAVQEDSYQEKKVRAFHEIEERINQERQATRNLSHVTRPVPGGSFGIQAETRP